LVLLAVIFVGAVQRICLTAFSVFIRYLMKQLCIFAMITRKTANLHLNQSLLVTKKIPINAL
jgi:hypothetical protein